ncbi:MAG: hypothetical protein K8H86_05270, partial [Ignavibacteriaceae bacterium]|nr:hypothetical protein [Ignavibacteriaceae bacterium]
MQTGKIKQFEKTKNNKSDKEPTNYIRTIVVGEPNTIWFNSIKGLSKLNILSEEIEYFQKDPFQNKIDFGIIRDLVAKNDLLYVSCDTGIVELNFKTSHATILLPQNRLHKIAGPGTFNSELYVDENNLFWIGTTNGLFVYNPTSDKLQYFQNENSNLNSITHNSILSFCKSKGDVFWIGTQSGLSKIDKIKNEFRLVKRIPDQKNTISGTGIGPIIEDRFGYTLFGTRSPEALNLLNIDTDELLVFKNEPNNKKSLSANYILSLKEDSKGNIWIGTKGGGLNKISYSGGWDKNIPIERIVPISLSGEISNIERVQSIYEDKSGLLWLGASGSGLYSYNIKSNRIKSFPYAMNGKGPSHTHIYSILEDKNNNFWIGTASGGLNLMDRASGNFLYINNEPTDFT